MPFFIMIIEAVVLASSLSLDAFAASFAYGANKIKLPMLSLQIVNLVCCFILGASLLAGTVVRQYLPDWITTAVCFSILFILGVAKLLDSMTKAFIRRHNQYCKEIKFSFLNFKVILNLYANPEAADADESKVISPAEAVSLAVALSLDGLAAGFGAALGSVSLWAILLASFIINMLALLLGGYIGGKAARKLPFDLAWASGAILIILAFAKLF